MLVSKYDYKKLNRFDELEAGRHYESPENILLPSVTTILSATGDKTAIEEWRKRIGEHKADEITKLSAGIGTIFHEHMECYMQDIERPGGTSYTRKRAALLADVVIDKAMHNVDEIWGIEAPLHYPGLYAGTADVIGVWKGKPAIMDFKNTRKPKKEEWIEDYYMQLCAYSMAHNKLYDTNIRTGVIMMVSREDSHLGEYQEFIIEDDKFDYYMNKWLDRIETYYDKIG